MRGELERREVAARVGMLKLAFWSSCGCWQWKERLRQAGVSTRSWPRTKTSHEVCVALK